MIDEPDGDIRLAKQQRQMRLRVKRDVKPQGRCLLTPLDPGTRDGLAQRGRFRRKQRPCRQCMGHVLVRQRKGLDADEMQIAAW